MRTRFHEKVQAIVIAASQLPREEQAAYIARAAGADEKIRAEALSLLPYFSPGKNDDPKSPCGRAFDGGTTTFRDEFGGPVDESEEPMESLRYIDQYRVDCVLGQGGMGVVYRGQHVTSGKTVAIKVLRASLCDATDRRRFAFEAEIMRRLHHPGIALMIHANMTESAFHARPYFVMEYVRGVPLTDYARERGLSSRERLALMTRVCEVVEYAHERGIIHLDLKPSNILVDPEGRPKILDFGISQVMSIPLPFLRDEGGPVACTPRYASPEQLSGRPSALTPRCDVYALGMITYELLTGQLPSYEAGRILLKLYDLQLSDLPDADVNRTREFRYYIGCILARSLHRTVSRRYLSAGALGADLEALGECFVRVSKWAALTKWLTPGSWRSAKSPVDRWQRSSVADPLYAVLRMRLAASMESISMDHRGEQLFVD